MSNREQCKAIIDEMPEQVLVGVLSILRAVDDALDDAHCVKLYDRAMAEDDGERVSHEEIKREFGLSD
ncbi:MAG: hypothetical protein LBM74_02425 [Oscillospiraceae bacterium]|jgi:hypothetical protein|nr:hypothetical protein [Oscillospiraceae bacterium]